MLSFDKPIELNPDGIPAWAFRDSDDIFTWYLLPQEPRIRRDRTTNKPALSLYKYRFPIDRPGTDGLKGGGYLFMDVELVIDDELKPKVQEKLQALSDERAQQLRIQTKPIKYSPVKFTGGSCRILFEEGDNPFVSNISSLGEPSLFGENVCVFSLELTPEGASFFEQTLRGEGLFAGVVYELEFKAIMPAVKVYGYISSYGFYSYFQEIDVDWSLWGEDTYTETVRESLIQRDAYTLEVTPLGEIEPELITEIRQWAQQTLDDRLEEMMIDSVTPIDPNAFEKPGGIEDVTRDIQKTEFESFQLNYKEHSVVSLKRNPQISLSGFGTMSDIDVDEHVREIDLDDDFFKSINVAIHVNADFDNLPLDSIEVKLEYKGEPMRSITTDTEGEYRFTSSSDVGKFAAFVQDDDWEYHYSYQINYRGESQIFQSQRIKTNESIITIGVDRIGIVAAEFGVGDINFDLVKEARVRVFYNQSGLPAPIEKQFRLDQDNRTALFQEVIFRPRKNPVEYIVTYFMKDGREIVARKQESMSANIYIDDPFSSQKTISIQAVGDLTNKIDNVFCQLKYADNDYTQEANIALNKSKPFYDWIFPVINENGGAVSCTEHIQFQNGTTKTVEHNGISGSRVIVGEKIGGILEIEIIGDIVADLLDVDFKLIRVVIEHDDGEGNKVKKSETFSGRSADNRTVKLQFKGENPKMEWSWYAQYYMMDRSKVTLEPVTIEGDEDIILDFPE